MFEPITPPFKCPQSHVTSCPLVSSKRGRGIPWRVVIFVAVVHAMLSGGLDGERFSIRRRSAPGEPRGCRRPASRAVFGVSSRFFQSDPFAACAHARAQLTISGLSVGFTLVPSNKKRTLVKDFP